MTAARNGDAPLAKAPPLPKGQTCLSGHFLGQLVFFHEQSNVVYLNNAKAGCSTIKASIIRAHNRDASGNVVEPTPKEIHGAWQGWSNRYDQIDPGSTFFFSMVRNPFVRVLSSYLDKIVRPGILRNQFMLQQGLPIDADLGFESFLAALRPDTTLLDQHWRPQVANLFLGDLRLDEVHFLEGFSETSAALARRIGPNVRFETNNSHGTKAAEKLRHHLTKTARDRIQQLYADDFATFGYSDDPDDADLAPGDPISLEDRSGAALRFMRLQSLLRGRKFDEIQALGLHTPSFAEACLLVNRNIAPQLFSVNEARASIRQRAQSDQPIERFQALVAISGFPDDALEGTPRSEIFRQILAMTPYFPDFRLQLIRHLIASGAHDEAEDEIFRLTQTSWQEQIAADLRGQLAMQRAAVAPG